VLAVTAPYFSSFSLGVYLTLAVVLGFFFGFFLERAGFSSARKLTAQFYFKDFSVLKVMFSAIVIAMLGIAYLALVGWLDMSQLYIPPTFIWPQIVGGLLLGAGFIVGGYCPGTSVAAAAIGKLDALFFIVGIFIGIFLFGAGVPHFAAFNDSGSLGPLTLPQWLNVNTGLVAFAIAAIALGAFWAAEKSEGPWELFKKTYGSEEQ
jgi:uncharacterized membrane protein YedE/YeeE